MKILLTGCQGQIGRELTHLLPACGDLVAADRTDADLADPDALRRLMRDVQPDLVVNTAAYTDVNRAEDEVDLAMAVNGEGPCVLAEECKRLGATILHFSTDYVFDGRKRSPLGPEDAPNPLSAYGRSKLAGEQAVIGSGAEHLIIRTGWVYGLRGRNFLLTMLRLGTEQPEIRVVDDQFGAPTWSRAVAFGTFEIVSDLQARSDRGEALGDQQGIYHLTCGGLTTWFGFAQRIFDLAGLDPRPQLTPIPTEEYTTPATRPPYAVLDCMRARRAFGVTMPDWETALRRALQSDPALLADLAGVRTG